VERILKGIALFPNSRRFHDRAILHINDPLSLCREDEIT
jgi:hypothetical protein